MRITQQGDYIRFQLIERVGNADILKFDFKIRKKDYEELKKHMIAALEAFKPRWVN